MSINKKLKQEVRDLYNEMFPWQIDTGERNVSKAVFSGFSRLYSEMNYMISAITCIRLNSLNMIKPERKKLEICKQLLLGNEVRLPVSDDGFRICEIYSDFVPGRKIDLSRKK
jgi:hypothetical protein